MAALLNSFGEWFQEKTSSPFWYTLFFSFILWNWQILYLLFGEDGNKFTGPRIEYICKNYFGGFTVGPNCNIVNAIINNGWFSLYILGPLMVAFLSIWVIPMVSNFAFRQRLKYIAKREKDIFDSETKEGTKRRTTAKGLVKDEEEYMRQEQEYEWANEKN